MAMIYAWLSYNMTLDWAPIFPQRITIGRASHHVRIRQPHQYFNNRQVNGHNQRERSTNHGSKMGVISKDKRVY